MVLQKVQNFRLTNEPRRCVSFQCFLNNGRDGLVAHQKLAMLRVLGVAISRRRMEDPIAPFDALFHFLAHLPGILLALQFALGGDDGFDELTFGTVLKLEVEAFHPRPALVELAPELDVEFGIACEAFEIVEDHSVAFAGLRIQKGQERHHAGTLHKIAAARDIIGEDGFDIVAVLPRMVPAARFLTFQPVPVDGLSWARHTTINHSSSCCFFLF